MAKYMSAKKDEMPAKDSRKFGPSSKTAEKMVDTKKKKKMFCK